jgi:hypothetical protein
MSNAEWITGRPPTEADGDMDGDVWMRLSPLTTMHFSVHWSYVGSAAPWQHTRYWKQMGLMARLSSSTAEAFESPRSDR